MTLTDAAERERQRFQHLVLGAPRPKPARRARRKGAPPATLAPGIEERVRLREEWGGRQATPETLAQVAAARPGAIARLHASGAIDRDQLAAAEEIVAAYRQITAAVRVKTASFETRTDGGRHGVQVEEAWARVRGEVAYDAWRALLGPLAPAMLAIIVEDRPLTAVAAAARISPARLRRALADALTLWWRGRPRAR